MVTLATHVLDLLTTVNPAPSRLANSDADERHAKIRSNDYRRAADAVSPNASDSVRGRPTN